MYLYSKARGSIRLYCRLAMLTAFAVVSPTFAQMGIDFNSGALFISDNGLGDLNPITGIIDFNTTVGSYSFVGTVDTGVGPNQVSLLGSPNANVRLTNFTAEALINAAGQFRLEFWNTFAGTYTGVVGADSIDAYVGHSGGLPVPPANDAILDWVGYVGGQIITLPWPGPPPYTNPFLPPSSPPLPYTVFGHGPAPVPPGTFVSPPVGGILTFDLRSQGDQLILYSSAEVGFTAVPEVNSMLLLAVASGMLGLGRCRRRLARSRVS
jgi:hypothetical protein